MHQSDAAQFAAAMLLIARFCIAAVFVRAGTVKLADRAQFRVAVANYRILPAGLAAPVAAGLPALEIAAGVLLLLGVFPGVVAAALAALLGFFAAAIAVNLARGRVFDCGCGGDTAPRLISWRHVAADAVLAVAAATLALAPPRGLDLAPGTGTALSTAVYSITVPAGSALPLALAAALCFTVARVLAAAARNRPVTSSLSYSGE